MEFNFNQELLLLLDSLDEEGQEILFILKRQCLTASILAAIANLPQDQMDAIWSLGVPEPRHTLDAEIRRLRRGTASPENLFADMLSSDISAEMDEGPSFDPSEKPRVLRGQEQRTLLILLQIRANLEVRAIEHGLKQAVLALGLDTPREDGFSSQTKFIAWFEQTYSEAECLDGEPSSPYKVMWRAFSSKLEEFSTDHELRDQWISWYEAAMARRSCQS